MSSSVSHCKEKMEQFQDALKTYNFKNRFELKNLIDQPSAGVDIEAFDTLLKKNVI